MRIIELDATGWKTPLDFLNALKIALGSCEGHGLSPDAFVDSMIWGGMNSVDPPYEIRICGSWSATEEVRDYIDLMISIIARGRQDKLNLRGDDTEVSIRIAAEDLS